MLSLFVVWSWARLWTSRDDRESDLAGERDESIPEPDYPDEAEAFRTLQLQDENGSIPPDGLLRAREHVQQMREQALSSLPNAGGINPASWTWLGPGNIAAGCAQWPSTPRRRRRYSPGASPAASGRRRTQAQRGNQSTIFMANLTVTTLVMQPGNPSTMYAGTGEGVYGHPGGTRGAGIFKSIDGGTTWVQLASTANSSFYYVNRLAAAPDGTLLAATTLGLWRSTNGGTSFTGVISATSTMSDVNFNPANPLLAVASGTSGNGSVLAPMRAPPGLPRRVFPVSGESSSRTRGASRRSSTRRSTRPVARSHKSVDGGASYNLCVQRVSRLPGHAGMVEQRALDRSDEQQFPDRRRHRPLEEHERRRESDRDQQLAIGAPFGTCRQPRHPGILGLRRRLESDGVLRQLTAASTRLTTSTRSAVRAVRTWRDGLR